MKLLTALFGLLTIGSAVAAFWNPFQLVITFCCLLMVINGLAHIKESVNFKKTEKNGNNTKNDRICAGNKSAIRHYARNER